MEVLGGFFILFFYGLIFGLIALVFSILFWRLKTTVFFVLGVIFTSFVLLAYLLNFEVLLLFFTSGNAMLTGIILLTMLILPVGFLIAGKSKSTNHITESDVTDDYLNEIINSDDEEIEFD